MSPEPFLLGKFFQIEEPYIVLILAVERHKQMSFCFNTDNKLLTVVFHTLTL